MYLINLLFNQKTDKHPHIYMYIVLYFQLNAYFKRIAFVVLKIFVVCSKLTPEQLEDFQPGQLDPDSLLVTQMLWGQTTHIGNISH